MINGCLRLKDSKRLGEFSGDDHLKSEFILDYSSFSSHVNEYGMNTHSSREEFFFGVLGHCPFCEIDAVLIEKKNDIFQTTFGPWREMNENVWQCSCGWWQIEFNSYLEGKMYWKDWHNSVYSAQLKKYEVNSNAVPIEVLQDYLSKNKDDVYSISDKKMEELVASIFREHFSCEVKQVGKSHDGGIDLIMIDADKQFMIQVKRRQSPGKIEPVKEIRDLLGATLLHDGRNCIFVTTADHFSKEAIKSSNQAVEKNIVESYQLYDNAEFFSLLRLYADEPSQKWKELVQFDRNHIIGTTL